ncbi:MAG: DNA-processing protein DprA [Fervidobacterium sp.]|uniref:DNA processing protein n=1 Tax=Fervidobacterium gondwanense DSM 13020 TaxID=1121883 RepID=A0A1M7S0W6_FERGO|nr:DNA-processing protein DprA [Fervidobacterium gondwanense]UXF00206.1 DNA processing protein DprA [Fervidobacterium riparium]SHN52108.1 DNA processing protein [Fervidobacterium gondwanense DSM 13020]
MKQYDSVTIAVLSRVFKKGVEEIDEYIQYGSQALQSILENSEDYRMVRARVVEYLSKNRDTSLITYWDEQYPEDLKHITHPPVCLFVRGNSEFLASSMFAIVGTRKITSYGKVVTEMFATELAKHFVIVSGMAYGVDTVAHYSALKVKRSTIAVLGSGIDYVYPKSNKSLYEEIIKNGCVVSEYLPWEEPKKYTFVERNRIISGLSKGVLVTEASIDSGALITAKFGLEQGKDIFAVPGDILRQTSTGPNYLIKSGAFLVTEPQDILDYYGFKNHRKLIELSEEEKELLESIVEESTIDSIVSRTGRAFSHVMLLLTTLELKGVVSRTERGNYIRLK